MEHPFFTKRHELERAREGLALAADVTALAALSAADLEVVRSRRDPMVGDEGTRAVLARRAGRLGMLLEDLDAVGGTEIAKTHGAAWGAYWQHGTAMPAAFGDAVQAAADKIESMRTGMQSLEADDASSSYSDYSDSSTVSSEDEGGAESDDGSDDGSEDDDNTASRDRKRRHRG
jgi:hypothetical protein